MQIEFEDAIPAIDLEPGDLAEVIQDPIAPQFNGRLVQMMEDRLILLGADDYYSTYDNLKVRRIAGVQAVDREPDTIHWKDMAGGQLGFVTKADHNTSVVGSIIQRQGGKFIVINSPKVSAGLVLSSDGYFVRILKPGTKIIL